MRPNRAVLILKGDICAERTLALLEKLMKQIAEEIGEEAPGLQPYNVFSLIGASGNVSPLAFLLSRRQSNIANCQEFVHWISANQYALESYPEWLPSVLSLPSKLKEWVKSICGDAELGAYRTTAARSVIGERTDPASDGRTKPPIDGISEKHCDIFIWKPRESTTAPPNHFASCSSSEKCDQITLSNLEAFMQILDFRNDCCVEFPLHGITNEVLARHGSHEYRVCIVLRAQSIDGRERSADWEQIEDLQSRFGEDGCFDIQMDGSNKDVVLKAAAQVLATWCLMDDIEEDISMGTEV
ncbi:hypothetical protein BKA63DRAFT_528552 [Paraphoma chrysanthemicola]|nr:hypothetical protein BKA63DRAFT_528552 [Paraphoma chrysanthemicola]